MEKLIYLDNAATTLCKPPGVAEAAAQAILTAGNAAPAHTVRPVCTKPSARCGRARCGSASPCSTRRTRRTWPFRR